MVWYSWRVRQASFRNVGLVGAAWTPSKEEVSGRPKKKLAPRVVLPKEGEPTILHMEGPALPVFLLKRIRSSWFDLPRFKFRSRRIASSRSVNVS